MLSRKKFVKIFSVMAIFGAFVCSLFSWGNTFALTSEEAFYRILINNVEYCYNQALVSSFDAKTYNNFDSLMNEGFQNAGFTKYGIMIPSIDVSSGGKVINGIKATDDGYSATRGARLTSCYALFNGDTLGSGLGGQMAGLFDKYGISVPGGYSLDNTKLHEFLTSVLEYKLDDNKDEELSTSMYCYTLVENELNQTAPTDTILAKKCINAANYPLSAAGYTFSFNENEITDAGKKYGISVEYIVPRWTDPTKKESPYFELTITNRNATQKCYKGRADYTCTQKIRFGVDEPEIGNISVITPPVTTPMWAMLFLRITREEGTIESSKDNTYLKGSVATPELLSKVISGVTKGAFSSKIPFSDADKYDFYLQYLKHYYGLDSTNASQCQAVKPDELANVSERKFYIYTKGRGWCLAQVTATSIQAEHAMTVFSNDERYRLNMVVNTLSDMINLIGELNYDDEEIPDIGAIGETDGTTEQPADEPGQNMKPTCSSSGAAGSLGWILCPLLDLLANASETLYSDYIEPSLQIQPTLFASSGSTSQGEDPAKEGTELAWGIFQGFANTVFIILLLLVIFSQLTGVGIDNYGIKKILPKLIIAAVLINISYIFCRICVDLSNIVGNGLQNLFNSLPTESMATSVGIPGGGSVDISEMSSSSGIGVTALTGVVLLGILVGGIWSAVSNNGVLGGLILPLLIAALTVVISIFFLFLLLSARQAAIIVLTVISPLACVCYILPNTKRLFDKWVKLGTGLLLVYPICGLLIGGGNYVSRLLLSAKVAEGGFAMAFMAMIVGVVPIFFIPSVLKSSFAAMGNIGARISSIGSKVRGGVTRSARNNKLYNDLQERSREKNAMRFAGFRRNADGTYSEKKMGRFGRFVRGGNRNIASNRARFFSDLEKKRQENDMIGDGAMTRLARVEANVEDQRNANAEALLGYNKATYRNDDGSLVTVNSGNIDSVGKYYTASLKKYHNAKTDRERTDTLAEIRAAQKLLSRTDRGRGMVQEGLANAVINGYGSGASAAAAYLQSNFGDVYKAKNRGANQLINDLASGVNLDDITARIGDGTYKLAGTDKYDQQSLVGADELALKNMVEAVNDIQSKISAGRDVDQRTLGQFNDIRGTAVKAIQMYDAGRLSIKPEALKYVEKIAGISAKRGETDDAKPAVVPPTSAQSTNTQSVNTNDVAREGAVFNTRQNEEDVQRPRIITSSNNVDGEPKKIIVANSINPGPSENEIRNVIEDQNRRDHNSKQMGL